MSSQIHGWENLILVVCQCSKIGNQFTCRIWINTKDNTRVMHAQENIAAIGQSGYDGAALAIP